ncbi:hypothetical protein GGG16DRAFT_28530, partial [Schizophyllum commune]
MTAIKDADKAGEKEPLVEKDADAKDGYDASDSDGDEHRSDESDEDTAHRQRVREERKRMEDALAKDERFTRPAVPVWKRAGLLLALGLLVWAALALREYANRPPTIIYASRYSEEYKYRPAASPIITETLRDGRLRVRGAAPTTSIKPTPTQTPTSKPGRKRRGKKRSKAKKSTKLEKGALSLVGVQWQLYTVLFPNVPLTSLTGQCPLRILTASTSNVSPILLAATKMYNSPPKRHGLFCRLRSMFVRRPAPSMSSDPWTAASSSFSSRTRGPRNASRTHAGGSPPPPVVVRDGDRESLPEIPDLPSPATVQNALQPSNLDGVAQDDSALSAQVSPLSPAVARLTLDEGLGDLEIPIHDLMAYVEYDSVLSTPPPASPPPNDAIATNSTSPAMSPPERRHRTLAHRNGRMPLRPASADADDDDAVDLQEYHPVDDNHSQGNDMSSVHSGVSDGQVEEQPASDDQLPEIRFHVEVIRSSDARLPGYELVVVVGSEAIDSIPYTDAVRKIEFVCALYRHELCHLSLDVRNATMADGRDSLLVIMECL